MRRTLLIAVALCGLGSGIWRAVQAAEPDEYQVKALFLVNFLRFTTWPEPAQSGPVVIGLIGEDPFGPALERAATTGRIGQRPIVVRRLSSSEELEGVHLLFIASSERRRLPTILRAVEGKPVLTVGDATGFAQAGVALNFYMTDGKVGFETNTAAAARAGVRLSAHLLRLARVVG